jgi:hypothetical protein
LAKVSDIEQLKRRPKGTPDGSESLTGVDALLICASEGIDTLSHVPEQHRRSGEQFEFFRRQIG